MLNIAKKGIVRLVSVLLVTAWLTALAFLAGCESSANPKVGDIRMAYWTYGEGYPLVMIMGYSGTMDMWDPNVITALSSQYQVIVFDNRGMGKTTAGTLLFSIEQFADDTAGLMDVLGIDEAHVLGWSMGTEIAQELVLRHPEKVNKLILYAADCQINTFPPSPEVEELLFDPDISDEVLLGLMFPEDWLEDHEDYLYQVFSGVTETSSAENIQRQVDAMDNWGGSCDRLSEINSPTLLITGSEDILTPPENSHMMVGKIPDVTLKEVEGAGHGLMYQYPEEFAAIVLNFLD
ncbi:alpha/beta fold hydrolase [Verrucomicrobiota bacterium]